MSTFKDNVEIYNAGTKEYRENWQDKEYVIPVGQSIQMKRRDAVNFIGVFPGKGIEKRLEIRRNNLKVDSTAIGAVEDPVQFISMIDGLKFPSQAALDAHLAKFKDQTIKIPRLEEKEEKISNLKEEISLDCPLCGKSVTGTTALKEHLKTHGQSKEEEVEETKEKKKSFRIR